MRRKPARNLIVDIGSATGEFRNLLKQKNPKCEVLGIDRGSYPQADVSECFGSFFKHQFREPERLKSIWLNHVDILSLHEGFPQLRLMVEKILPGTPVILTVRKSSLGGVKEALALAGLEVKSQFPGARECQAAPSPKNTTSKPRQALRSKGRSG